MKIKLSGKDLPKITIRDLVDSYQDGGEDGVVGYGGKLNIRPAFQREFIYGDKERDAVIKTVRQGFPLNTMYWSVDEDGKYELMDGQQRTVSICQYVTKIIPIKFDDEHELAFTSLPKDQQEQILNYELSVYVCDGTPSEKLAWFRTINIAGKPLTEQELLNAQHTGKWLTDAKRWFSKTSAPAIQDGRDKLVTGSPIRQEILETVLRWISGDHIEKYMNEHKDDADAQELWQYWQSVFDWVQRTFIVVRKEMKSVEWGVLYAEYYKKVYNPTKVSAEVHKLYGDPYIQNHKGIFEYILGGSTDTKLLEVRMFDDATKRVVYEEQTKAAEKKEISNCPLCAIGHDANKDKIWKLDEMDADHVAAWSKGGATSAKNCQMLCKTHNRAKGNR